MELEKYTLGSLRKAVVDGDVKNGSLMAGQVSRHGERNSASENNTGEHGKRI